MASQFKTPPAISRLIEEFQRLPGIGPKMAQRLTYHLLRQTAEDVRSLAEAISALKDSSLLCSLCQNISDRDPCPLCTDPQRDAGTICVVEDPLDVLALERAGGYRGRYHVLHGVLSPRDGLGPEDLKIKALLRRLEGGGVSEVILATNPSLEGEATALYLKRLISPLGIRVTGLARGLPVGGELEYADEVTLRSALEGRREL